MIIPDHIQQAIQSYYAERATPEEIASLESWFREDIEHVRMFAQHGMLEWQLLCEVEKADAAAILTILREAEAKAKPDFSLLRASAPEMAPIEPDETPVTLRDLWYVAGYLAVKGLRSKTAVIGSIAAALVFGAVLYVSILGLGSAPKPLDVASDPNRPIPIVATLTAEHNAAWDRRPGHDLYAGQRLTLTAGYAEITTKNGAVALIEAPATIELLDHKNAIRLHTGKLVGICETESSKGFLVRTPHIDVIDIGTQFGTRVMDDGSATIAVLQGEAVVHEADLDLHASPRRVSLVAGQKVNADIKGRLADAEQLELDHGFMPNWEAVAFRVGVEGQARYLNSAPTNIQKGHFDKDYIVVFRESTATLTDPIPVWSQLAPDQPATFDNLPAGRRVVSYFVHSSPTDPTYFETRLSFPGRILGVISDKRVLFQTNETLGLDATRYVEFGTTEYHNHAMDQRTVDSFTITGDRGNMLQLSLGAGQYPDQCRVLVEVPVLPFDTFDE